jgi:hypothetical protein
MQVGLVARLQAALDWNDSISSGDCSQQELLPIRPDALNVSTPKWVGRCLNQDAEGFTCTARWTTIHRQVDLDSQDKPSCELTDKTTSCTIDCNTTINKMKCNCMPSQMGVQILAV